MTRPSLTAALFNLDVSNVRRLANVCPQRQKCENSQFSRTVCTSWGIRCFSTFFPDPETTEMGVER